MHCAILNFDGDIATTQAQTTKLHMSHVKKSFFCDLLERNLRKLVNLSRD